MPMFGMRLFGAHDSYRIQEALVWPLVFSDSDLPHRRRDLGSHCHWGDHCLEHKAHLHLPELRQKVDFQIGPMAIFQTAGCPPSQQGRTTRQPMSMTVEAGYIRRSGAP